jgi:DNA repair protein RadC
LKEQDKKLGIKSWSIEDRPREKLIEKGAQSLTTAELLAILIGSGTTELTALDLAKKLLHQFDDKLSRINTSSIKELTKIKGIGIAKAVTIAASMELSRRRKDEENEKVLSIASSKDVYNYIYPYLADAKQEYFYLILLSRSNVILKNVFISKGGVAGTVVDTKIIFKEALSELASGIILCHNHPSGNNKPSQADIDLTRKIQQGARLFDISLLDHLIFTNNSYFSFADEGLL